MDQKDIERFEELENRVIALKEEFDVAKDIYIRIRKRNKDTGSRIG